LAAGIPRVLSVSVLAARASNCGTQSTFAGPRSSRVPDLLVGRRLGFGPRASMSHCSTDFKALPHDQIREGLPPVDWIIAAPCIPLVFPSVRKANGMQRSMPDREAVCVSSDFQSHLVFLVDFVLCEGTIRPRCRLERLKNAGNEVERPDNAAVAARGGTGTCTGVIGMATQAP